MVDSCLSLTPTPNLLAKPGVSTCDVSRILPSLTFGAITTLVTSFTYIFAGFSQQVFLLQTFSTQEAVTFLKYVTSDTCCAWGLCISLRCVVYKAPRRAFKVLHNLMTPRPCYSCCDPTSHHSPYQSFSYSWTQLFAK